MMSFEIELIADNGAVVETGRFFGSFEYDFLNK